MVQSVQQSRRTPIHGGRIHLDAAESGDLDVVDARPGHRLQRSLICSP